MSERMASIEHGARASQHRLKQPTSVFVVPAAGTSSLLGAAVVRRCSTASVRPNRHLLTLLRKDDDFDSWCG